MVEKTSIWSTATPSFRMGHLFGFVALLAIDFLHGELIVAHGVVIRVALERDAVVF